MRSRAARAVVAIGLVLGGGCYRMTFKFSKAVAEAGAPREVQHQSLASGLWDLSGPVMVEELCPQGAASVQVEESVANGLGQNLSSAIISVPAFLVNPLLIVGVYWVAGRHAQPWAPSTVRLTCAKGKVRSIKYVVLRLEAKGGLEPATVGLFSDALVGELRKNPGLNVMTGSDVEAVLGAERQQQLLGCTDTNCLTELAGALGADRVVHGSVGRVGESLVVNLTAVDPKSGRAVASVSERLKGGGDEAFLDALPALVFRIVSEP
ncbi:MAG TPA: DUF2380 domain-containing protein [Myxococcaceae bacterium]|nr:DUF2380 domain-containing protein [Myxococcaceae bacterium]